MLKLENYSPTFRNILLKEVKEEKTVGGIYIPLSAKRQEETVYEVIKVGKDCVEVEPGHQVYLGPNCSYTSRTIEGESYIVVNELQIEGKFNKQATMEDFGHTEVLKEPISKEEWNKLVKSWDKERSTWKEHYDNWYERTGKYL